MSRERIDSIWRAVSGLLWQHKHLKKRVAACEQAILEMDEALRRSGIGRGELALPSPSENLVPDLQSAEPPSKISP